MIDPAAATRTALARLRLAARALVEWKTPSSSDIYQSIVAELISHHPSDCCASQAKISHLLAHDEGNTFLWYLSETLADEERATHKDFHTQVEVAATSVVGSLLRGLRSGGLIIKEVPKAWLGRHRSVSLRSLIVQALESPDESTQQAGAKALVAACVPFEDPDLRKWVTSLADQIGFVLFLLKSASSWARGIYDGMLVSINFTRILSITLVLSAFILMIVDTQFFDKFIGILFNDQVSIQIKPTSAIFFSIVGAVVGLFPSMVKIIVEHREAVIVNRIEVGTSKLLIELRTETRVENDVASKNKAVIRAVGEMCGTDARAWRQMVTAHTDTHWKALALFCTSQASVAVVSAALNMLRSTQIEKETQRMIFQWLCRIDVLDDPSRIDAGTAAA